ncbi:MAG: radical SAM protein [Longimicrobiales bacterium]
MTRDAPTGRRQLPVVSDKAPAEIPAHPGGALFEGDRVRIGMITLGCDKNTVDTERTLARLAGAGATVQSGADDVDVVIINTCGFIDSAKEESIETILEAVRMKKDGTVRAVVAMGCLVQRYKSELEVEIPEVDLFLGLTEADRLVPTLRARGVLPETPPVSLMEQPLRLLSTHNRHTSYLKVSEGCDHTCAFCAIPLMRGKHRSTPMDVLVREAQQLSAAGVVELNLISQDTTWYGRDLARGFTNEGDHDYFVGKTFDGMAGPLDGVATATRSSAAATITDPAARNGLLPVLLRRLLNETEVPWFRLFYMYPSGISRELVELMAGETRLLPYLDMPIQHGSDSILKRMRRPERVATIRERVSWLRGAIPDLTLRTTVIVGFPGETDDDFDAMLDLLREIRFDRLGAFPYSPEESTLAASMSDMVPDVVKRERMELLFDVQRAITLERNDAWVGRETQVMIDEIVGRDTEIAGDSGARGAIARTRGQAIEVDGVVHIDDARGAKPGDMLIARITDALEDDLVGELV